MSNPAASFDTSGTQRAAASAQWVREVNGVVRGQLHVPSGSRNARPRVELLSSHEAEFDGFTGRTIEFSGAAAEAAVRRGLHAQVLGELAQAAGIDVRHLHEFTGLDRTTVSRRAARGEALPHDASVKAMEFAELSATAVDVFGDVRAAARWLTTAHPMLEDETPLQRARTPWGARRVLSMLAALKYGAAA